MYKHMNMTEVVIRSIQNYNMTQELKNEFIRIRGENMDWTDAIYIFRDNIREKFESKGIYGLTGNVIASDLLSAAYDQVDWYTIAIWIFEKVRFDEEYEKNVKMFELLANIDRK